MQPHAVHETSSTQPKLAGPLYNQIQLLMRERILAREWRDGKNLPTEVDLAREYSVSIGTMRKALDVLEDAKLIVRKQGLGTFIRNLDTDVAGQKIGWTFNGKPSVEHIVRILSTASMLATRSDCAALEIGPRSTIHRLKFVSSIDRRGSALDEYIICDTPGFIFDHSDADGLQSAIQTLQRQSTRYSESIAIEIATTTVSQTLRVDVGTALLRIERTAYDAKGRALFMCVRLAHLEGARYNIEVDRP